MKAMDGGVAQGSKTIVQMTRRGVVVWALLILFIAVWMFVLGILVGRGTAPLPLEADRLQQELAELKTALMEKEQAEMEAQASDQSEHKSQLGFYEALKETRRPQPASAAPRPKTETVAKPGPGPAARLALEIEGKPVASSSDAPDRPTPPRPAPAEQTDDKPVGRPTAPVEKNPALPKAPPPPASRPAASAASEGGAFTIQVGAFKDSPSAEQEVARLRAKGFPAYQIRSQSAEKGVWHRVRVGAFTTRAAAQTMLKKMEEGQIKGIIVGTP